MIWFVFSPRSVDIRAAYSPFSATCVQEQVGIRALSVLFRVAYHVLVTWGSRSDPIGGRCRSGQLFIGMRRIHFRVESSAHSKFEPSGKKAPGTRSPITHHPDQTRVHREGPPRQTLTCTSPADNTSPSCEPDERSVLSTSYPSCIHRAMPPSRMETFSWPIDCYDRGTSRGWISRCGPDRGVPDRLYGKNSPRQTRRPTSNVKAALGALNIPTVS